MYHVSSEGSVWAQDTQNQVLSAKEIYFPKRDKGRGIRGKDMSEGMRERGRGVCTCGDQRTASG